MAQVSPPQNKQKEHSHKQTLALKVSNINSSLLLSWEISLILFIAGVLRLFNINRAMFNDDEASVFRIAHDAVAFGLLPLTSNRASLGNLNPPLVVYFLMLPASLSANPLWGQVMVALFNTAAVALTYFFTRRYYGRLAGTIAALLYASSIGALTFSPNISPQNFLLFSTYIYWELHSPFSDITVILSATNQQATLDPEALHLYLSFLHPPVVSPSLDVAARIRDTHIMLPDAQSILMTTPLRYLHSFTRDSFYLTVLLLVVGIAIAALQVLSPQYFL